MAFKKDVQIHLTELTPEHASDRHILQQQPPERPPLVQWPSNPQPLTNEPLVDRVLDAYDVTLCLIPLLLIAKVILVIVVWRHDRNSTGIFVDEVSLLTTFLVQFNGQLTTAFTIVFVLIVSTLMRRLALFRAQHGESVAQLEQYQASVSLPSTLKTIWSLRAFNFTSLFLLLIWSFYYLGSQASQREFEFVNSGSYKKIWAATLNASAPSLFQGVSLSTLSSDQTSTLNQQYALAMLSQQPRIALAEKGFDINSWVVVPWLGKSFPSVEPDRHGWYDVHAASAQTPSSVAGSPLYVPVYDGIFHTIDTQSLGKYTFNGSYLILDCSKPSLKNASAFPSGTISTISMSLNMTNITGSLSSTVPRNLDVWGRFGSKAVHATCSITMVHVEVHVRCEAPGCVAQKMRYILESPPSYRTPFDDDQFASVFFDEFLRSSGTPATLDNTSLAYQFSGLPGTDNGYNDTPDSFDPDHYEGNAIGYYLTPSINAYYQLSQNPFFTSVENEGVRLLLSEMLWNGTQTKYTSTFALTKMKGADYNPHYAISISWIIVDLISCKILFAAAMTSFWLRKRTLAPDIFGYVSSLTRDNPNLHLPDGGTTLSGLERARLLKDVRIRIADVGPSEGVGRVGLSYARSESWQKEHLSRDKHYI